MLYRLRPPATKIQDNFQNCHIWALNLPIGQNCTYIFFLPQVVRIELIFALRAAVSDIQANSQKLPYLGMKLGHGQSDKSCTYTLFLPHGVGIELGFALRAAISEIRADFLTSHIWA